MSLIELSEIAGNVGEFIGSIAVLATLIYLTVQVRHSRELLEKQDQLARSQVRLARLNTLIQRIGIAQSTDLPRIHIKHRTSGYDALDEEEKWRLRNSMIADIAHQDFALSQEEIGLLDREEADSTRRRIESFYPGWKEAGLPIPRRIEEAMKQVSDDID